MPLKGIDISQWQQQIDFKKVKQDNIDFCIIRQGYKNTVDPYFFTYVKEAKAVNLPIHGVYHFCYSINTKEALQQAKTCLTNVKKAGLPQDTIVFFDFQYDTVDKAKKRKPAVYLGKKECISFTETFCNYIISQGYKTGVYCNLDYYENMYTPEIIKKYNNFWLAQYNGGKTPKYECTYHQYSSEGKVNGIPAGVDLNYYYGTKQLLSASEQQYNTTVTTDFNKYYGKISNCGHDQNYTAYGGRAGDNTGSEWEIRNWYNRPWDCILRYPQKKVADLIAELSIQAANNDLVGYDQWERNTYWQHLKASNYRPSQITIACETDCSAGVIANVKAVGYLLNINALKYISATYTGNMKNAFKAAGFEVLTDYKYLSSYDYLKPGDILLNEIHHTAINLGIGTKSEYNSQKKEQTSNLKSLNKIPKGTGVVTAAALNVRTWAGVENPNIKSYPILYKENRVDICDTIKDKKGNDWYYIRIAGQFYGFVSSNYIKKD